MTRWQDRQIGKENFMKIYQFRFVVYFVERRGPAIAPRLTLNLRNHPAPA